MNMEISFGFSVKSLSRSHGLVSWPLLIIVIVTYCPFYAASTPAEIISAPENNITLPLGHGPATFTCEGRGTFLLWKVNGTLVLPENQATFESRGFTFPEPVHHDSNSTKIIRATVSVATPKNNNTEIKCHATGQPGPSASNPINITIAGPPLTPRPEFNVINATHIKVQWDKPFTLPEFDVKNYTLTTVNTSLEADDSARETFNALMIKDSDYPFVHYVSNRGVIPQDCVYLNFTLTATNEAGTSDEGFTTGGFAIAPSSINTEPDSFSYNVTFTTDLTPMLHIRFKFPKVCEYHDANYSISILNGDGGLVQKTSELMYNNDGRDSVSVEVTAGMNKDTAYTAVITVTTAVNSSVTQFTFKAESNSSLKMSMGTANKHTIFIASSSSVAGFFALLLLLLTLIIVAVFIRRRRKLKLRVRARQQEAESDEAVQRATLAMVPNPIYSGNPIYDEIADPRLLKFLNNCNSDHSDSQSRDEAYVEISGNPPSMLGSFSPPDVNKVMNDKRFAFADDTYTIMNPAGSLVSSPVNMPPTNSLAQRYGNDTVSSGWDHSRVNGQSNGRQTGATVFSNPANVIEDEERYVKGGF